MEDEWASSFQLHNVDDFHVQKVTQLGLPSQAAAMPTNSVFPYHHLLDDLPFETRASRQDITSRSPAAYLHDEQLTNHHHQPHPTAHTDSTDQPQTDGAAGGSESQQGVSDGAGGVVCMETDG